MLLCAFLEKSRRPPLVGESLVCQLASSQFLTDFSLPAASSPLTFVFKTSLIAQFFVLFELPEYFIVFRNSKNSPFQQDHCKQLPLNFIVHSIKSEMHIQDMR